jgi:hypothetical protein
MTAGGVSLLCSISLSFQSAGPMSSRSMRSSAASRPGVPFAAPCIRQTVAPWTAGARHGFSVDLARAEQSRRPARSRILSAGIPSIVVATLDLSPGWRTHQVWLGMVKSFVGRVLDNDDYDSSVHYHAAVPNVVAVWQPGQAEYDLHSELPRD